VTSTFRPKISACPLKVNSAILWPPISDPLSDGFLEAAPFGQKPGTFTTWTPLPAHTDLLFFEGLHGGVITDDVGVAQYPNLLI
jgi:hypothetical protein